VAEKALPSVVTVLSTKTLTMGRGRRGFRDFFSQSRGRREFKQHGLGSGVIVSQSGLILTNNHVIAEADQLRVRLHSGEELNAKVIGTDPRSDIAVIKVDRTDLTPAPIGNSDKLRIAEVVLCVGSPLSEELGHTVTQGIVSAKGRNSVGVTDYEDFIQTDAAINPGNSGGPMLNLDGEVVGINTAIASRTGGFQGVGFAVPSNMAKSVMEQLVSDGRVRRGWLGVVIQDLTPSVAEAMDLEGKQGVLVSERMPRSPAEKAGIQQGDLLVQLDGSPLKSVQGLRNRVAQTSPGTQSSLKIIRDGSEMNIQVTIGELPSDIKKGKRPTPTETKPRLSGLDRIGVNANKLTRDRKKALNLNPKQKGIEVVHVEPDSIAYQAGIVKGDILVEINRKQVKNLKDANDKLTRLKKGASLLLKVKRGGGPLFLAVRMP